MAGIEVEDLRYGYGGDGFQLRIPALRVDPGERLACIGPSGSGKTTFLNLVAGILLPDAGRVQAAGVDWAALPESERRRARLTRIGLVFQEFELLEHLSVRENILLPLLLHPTQSVDSDTKQRFCDLVRASGLESLTRRRPRDLSHGERQRVALCRALVTRPSILLADEPTGNLDPRTTGRVLELLLAEAARARSTVVMVTHDHALLDSFERVVDFREYGAEGEAA